MAAEGPNVSPLGAMILMALMGPRPDGRGRIRGAARTGLTAPRQWGCDRMAAEGYKPVLTVTLGKRTRQWGRDRMAAEG